MTQWSAWVAASPNACSPIKSCRLSRLMSWNVLWMATATSAMLRFHHQVMISTTHRSLPTPHMCESGGMGVLLCQAEIISQLLLCVQQPWAHTCTCGGAATFKIVQSPYQACKEAGYGMRTRGKKRCGTKRARPDYLDSDASASASAWTPALPEMNLSPEWVESTVHVALNAPYSLLFDKQCVVIFWCAICSFMAWCLQTLHRLLCFHASKCEFSLSLMHYLFLLFFPFFNLLVCQSSTQGVKLHMVLLFIGTNLTSWIKLYHLFRL